jgi:hypothetical protein
MAGGHPEAGLDADSKTAHQTSTDAKDPVQRAAGQHGPVEYDVARIEKVYRKLDRRIIPGMMTVSLQR